MEYVRKKTLMPSSPSLVSRNRWRKLRVFVSALSRFLEVRKNIITYGLTKPIEYAVGVDEKSPTKVSRFLFYPNSRLMKMWYFVMMMLLLYTAIFIPLRLGFTHYSGDSWIAVDTMIDCFFMANIFITFNLAYENDNTLITNRRTICKNYLKSWLIIDILSSIPMQLFQDPEFSASNQYLRLFRFNRTYKLLNLLKFLRIVKTSYRARRALMIRQNSSVWFNSFFFFLVILVVLHSFGCFWVAISSIEDYNSVNWYTRYQMDDRNDGEVYLSSVYYVFVTLTTVGYGDYVPVTNPEKIFAIGLMGFGIWFYSFLIGHLNTIFKSIDSKEALMKTKLTYLSDFSKAIALPNDLHTKIKHHLQLNVHKAYFSLIGNDFLEEIPYALREELTRFVNRKTVENIYFFHSRSIGFLSAVVPRLKKSQFQFNDVIYSQNDPADEIYFITKGRAHFRAENKVVFRTYSSGSYFGEIEIIDNTPRFNSVISATPDFSVLILVKSDFFSIFPMFPDIYEEMAQCSKLRKAKNIESRDSVVNLKNAKQNSLSFYSLSESYSSSSSISANSDHNRETFKLIRKDTEIFISVKNDTKEKKRNRALWSCAVEGHAKGKIYKRAKTMKAELASKQSNLHLYESLVSPARLQVLRKPIPPPAGRETLIGPDWIYDDSQLEGILKPSEFDREEIIEKSNKLARSAYEAEMILERAQLSIASLQTRQKAMLDLILKLSQAVSYNSIDSCLVSNRVLGF